MKKTEIERLRQEILTKNIYLRQMRIWFLLSTLVALACALVAFWGFSGVSDSFLPNISVATRQPIAWVATAIGACALFFSGLVIVALINGRKHVLSLIDQLNSKTGGKVK